MKTMPGIGAADRLKQQPGWLGSPRRQTFPMLRAVGRARLTHLSFPGSHACPLGGSSEPKSSKPLEDTAPSPAQGDTGWAQMAHGPGVVTQLPPAAPPTFYGF